MPTANVALCITDLDIGGAERALVDLAVRLDRDRFEPVVYCLGTRPVREAASCVPPLEQAGIEVHFMGAKRAGDLFSAVGRLSRLFERRKPDLVQCFLFHANLVGRLAARKAQVRPVLAGIRVAERQRRWHLWLDWLTSRWVDRYVCVSRSVANFSIQKGGLPQRKVHVIPNGIDATNFHSPFPADTTVYGIVPPRRVVSYVGRLDRQKGLDWLISSAPQWLGSVEDCDLLIVGDGPEKETLEAIAARTGLASRIHFAGWVKDVPGILAASHLFVLPSRWEGMPNVLLQAMAGRLPVVATDVEGVWELLGPRAQLQTVRHGDSEALSARILAILADQSLAMRLGEANRARAENEFTLERVVAAYQDLWDSLLRAK